MEQGNNQTLDKKALKKKKIKKIITTTLFVLLNVAVIAFTGYTEFSKDHPKRFDVPFGIENVCFLILALLCIVLFELIDSLRYRRMSIVLGEPCSIKDCVQVVLLGKYYDSITPSGSGGQPFQIYFLHKHGYSDGTSATITLGGYFTMQTAFVLLSIIVLITNSGVIKTPGIIPVAIVGTFTYSIIPAFIILFAKKPNVAINIVMFFVRLLNKIRIIKDVDKTSSSIISSLEEYSDGMKKLTSNKLEFAKQFLSSVAARIIYCLIPFFVLLGLGGQADPIEILCMTVIIMAAMTVIPTPGNSGAAEASFYLVFSTLESNAIFWAMLIWRFLCYYGFILVGVSIYSYRALKKKFSKKKNSNS